MQINESVVRNYYLYRSEMSPSKRYVWTLLHASQIIIRQSDFTRVTGREEIRSSVEFNLTDCGSTTLQEFLFKILNVCFGSVQFYLTALSYARWTARLFFFYCTHSHVLHFFMETLNRFETEASDHSVSME